MYFGCSHEVHATPTERLQQYKHTLTVQRRLIKTYKTELLATALKAESQAHTLVLYRTFRNGAEGRTTGLQTHSYILRSLTGSVSVEEIKGIVEDS